jgi:dihydroorotate dehydrogenase
MNGLALSSGKQDIIIDPPIMNSAGILGFAPDIKSLFDHSLLGAFITHPLSLKRRLPAKLPHLEPYPGGVLLHTGLPNSGLQGALREHQGLWETHPRPIIAHIIGSGLNEMKTIVEQLDKIDHPIQALEIGLERAEPDDAEAILTAANLSQLPILARVPPDTDHDVLQASLGSGVNAMVMGPPRGSIATSESATTYGRLYGSGNLPLALNHLERFIAVLDIPVILGCGLFSAEDIRTAFRLGAAAVQLDTILWLDPTHLLSDLDIASA